MVTSSEPISCPITDCLEIALAVVVAVPALAAFVTLKETQRRLPGSQLLEWLVGKPWT